MHFLCVYCNQEFWANQKAEDYMICKRCKKKQFKEGIRAVDEALKNINSKDADAGR